jgi:trehalose 6-phosphate synthase/phosphatase
LARRQVAKAQNHIFDRWDHGLHFISLHPTTHTPLPHPASVITTIYASSPAKPVSLSSQTISLVLPLSGQSFTLVGCVAWMSPDLDGPGNCGTELDFFLGISGGEKLLRKLNEFDLVETCCSAGGRARWCRYRVEVGGWESGGGVGCFCRCCWWLRGMVVSYCWLLFLLVVFVELLGLLVV